METAFEDLARAFDAPLVVVTAAAGDQRAGCVVGFHSQCSIDPPRYALWLSKANFTYRVALFATHVALHGLSTSDHELASLFGGESGDHVDKFVRCAWTPGPGDVPLLTACPNRVVLARTSLHDDGGDHVCLVGAPVEAAADAAFSPLRLHAVADLADLTPGHEATDRPTPAQLRS